MAADSIGTHIPREKVMAAYCGLGENWWMQLFDGKYHIHGPMVFDEGLHESGTKEPGFYTSAYKAHQFVQEHLCEPLSVQFYLDLHKTACAHFSGKANNTGMTADMTGRFRVKKMVSCKVNIRGFLQRTQKKTQFTNRMISAFMNIQRYPNISASVEKKVNWLNKVGAIQITVEEYEKMDCFLQKYLYKLREEIEEFHQIIGLPPESPETSSLIGIGTRIQQGVNFISITYNEEDPFSERTINYYRAVETLFNKFKCEISEAESREKAILLIAQLFQRLEWLHPFLDGQGRTDLFLLSKLLSEYGLHPALLEHPYTSTFGLLSDWVEYLKEGMQLWEKQRRG